MSYFMGEGARHEGLGFLVTERIEDWGQKLRVPVPVTAGGPPGLCSLGNGYSALLWAAIQAVSALVRTSGYLSRKTGSDVSHGTDQYEWLSTGAFIKHLAEGSREILLCSISFARVMDRRPMYVNIASC